MSPQHLSLLSDLLYQAAAPGAGLAAHPLGGQEITVTKLSPSKPRGCMEHPLYRGTNREKRSAHTET